MEDLDPVVPGDLARFLASECRRTPGNRVPVQVGDSADQMLTPLGWRPDGSGVLFLRIDRLFKKLELVAASAATGKARVLVSDRQDTFIEGLSFLSAAGSMFYPLADGSKFIWRSERDGWSHLYLYDGQGTLIRRLTAGEAPVERVEAIDEKNRGEAGGPADRRHRRPHRRVRAGEGVLPRHPLDGRPPAGHRTSPCGRDAGPGRGQGRHRRP